MKVYDFFKKFNIEKNSDNEFALSFVLNKKRSELIFCDINNKQAKKFFKLYKRLQKNVPLDLILKQSCFYGRNFYVNKNVLKPRMDSEFVVEQALKIISANDRVLDLCCGSGVLGITLAKEKDCSVSFSDISSKALKVCRKNLKFYKVNTSIFKSDLFEKINAKFDVVICNPPYIKTKDIEKLDSNVKNFDPYIALNGGSDGLEFYRKIIKQAKSYLNHNGRLIFEVGYNQGEKILKLMQKDFNASLKKDYNNNDRVIIGEVE